MDWLTNIPDWLSLLFGGSLISVITWRFARQKAAAEAKEAEAKAKQAEAEAKKAEAEALKEKQDYYQQMAEDLAKDRDYYKGERDEYRAVIKRSNERMDELERNQARQGRMIEAMRPFLCADLSCKLRKRVVLSADEDAKTKDDPNHKRPNRKRLPELSKPSTLPDRVASADIEPYNED